MDFDDLQHALAEYTKANIEYQQAVQKDTDAYITFNRKSGEVYQESGSDMLGGKMTATKFEFLKSEKTREEKMMIKVSENGVKIAKAKMDKALENLNVVKILIRK